MVNMYSETHTYCHSITYFDSRKNLWMCQLYHLLQDRFEWKNLRAIKFTQNLWSGKHFERKICYYGSTCKETDACHLSYYQPANIIPPKIQIKRITPSQRVWKDSGSGAYKDGSFWTASETQLENDYKLLGEMSCVGSYSTACQSMILVKEQENILIEPTGTEVIWTDGGSGAHVHVAIYRLVSPSDQFKCLGAVVIASATTQPDLRLVFKLMIQARALIGWHPLNLELIDRAL